MLISRTKIYCCVLILTSISVILAFSSCSGNVNGTAQSSELQVSVLPSPDIAANASVSPSDGDTDSSNIVPAEELDTSKPYVKIYNPYGEVTYIQLDEKTADDLNKDLGTMKEADILQYIGTKNEFHSENVYLFIGNKLVEEQTFVETGYSVLRNSGGKMCLQDSYKGMCYDADYTCSKLIAISRNLGVISDITNDKISTVVKAELWVNDVKRLEITEKETLEKLESMFRNSERMVNPSTYNIAAVLIITNADGKCIEIELDDISDICIIGHTYWYDYGPGTDGDNSRNNLSELFRLLGITVWPNNKQKT